MKALKKGKKYTRVQPLPDEWLSPKEVASKAEMKNDYQNSFKELKTLLDGGWKFCGKEDMRKFEKSKTDAKKPNKKTNKKTNKKPTNKKPAKNKNERKRKTRA